MSDFNDPITDEQFDRYLDDLLSAAEQEEFEARLATDPQAQHRVELQRAFDEQLRQEYRPPKSTVEQIEDWLDESEAKRSPLPRRRRMFPLLLSAVAAGIVWFIVATQWGGGSPRIEPFFKQRPLVELYEETVGRGFRPYYFCEDEERFALTFRKRQDVALVLEETPDDRRMVGLSYLGGFSRDTTAMLAYAQEKPVVVFVDRKQSDNQDLATSVGVGQLHVHRRELGNLVLYEVSPFDAPAMSQFLRIAE